MTFQAYLDEMRRLRRPELGNLALVEKVGSTSGLARRIAEECMEEGICLTRAWIVAYEQTEGRGRQGRPWASPPGAGLYATLLLPLGDFESSATPPALSESLTTLPLLTATAVCRAVDRRCDLAPCRLKWPNDLLMEGAKLGGVLIETIGPPSKEGVALLGVGVNYLPGRYGEVDRSATTVGDHCSQAPSLAEFTWQVLSAVDEQLEQFGDTAVAIEGYRKLSAHQPGDLLRCRVGNGLAEGIFRGFDQRGFLRLEVDGKEHLLAAGEVIEC